MTKGDQVSGPASIRYLAKKATRESTRHALHWRCTKHINTPVAASRPKPK